MTLQCQGHNGEEIANEKSITPLMKAEVIKKDRNHEEDFDELEDEDVDEDLLSLDSYYSADIIDEEMNLKCSSKSNKRITIEITVLGVIYELVTTLRGALHLSLGSRFAMATHIVAQQPNYVSKTQNSNQHQPIGYHHRHHHHHHHHHHHYHHHHHDRHQHHRHQEHLKTIYSKI
uniref:Uncharacterized protein n=1 Tax=Glossina austeni TaxID=7395 RepID=A0A1A9VXI7_GLOAU